MIKDTTYCCKINKTDTLNNFLKSNNIKCWLSAPRKDQSQIREVMVEFEETKNGIHKVLPVLNWSAGEVFEYIKKNDLPLHPLYNLGYESIGCEPCTHQGKGREGRWKNEDKTECGLHL